MEYVQSWELTPVEREWVNRNDENSSSCDRYNILIDMMTLTILDREAASKFIQDLNEEILKVT